MAVLAQAHHLLPLVDGQHDDGTRVLEGDPGERLVGVPGSGHPVLAQGHHPVVAVDVPRGDDRPAGRPVGEGLVRSAPVGSRSVMPQTLARRDTVSTVTLMTLLSLTKDEAATRSALLEVAAI